MKMNTDFSIDIKSIKKPLLVAVLILLLGLRLFPFIQEIYNKKKESLATLQAKLNYQTKIALKKDSILQEYAALPAREKRLYGKLLTGGSAELVNSNMRTVLNTMARQNNIVINTMSLPKFSKSGAWVLVTQSIVFDAVQKNLLSFVRTIRNGKYYLPIVSMELRQGKKGMLHCSMKLVGFGKLETDR